MLDCSVTLFDKIFTYSVLYILFISDLILTFINLKKIKILYPKNYLSYERNIIIKKLIKKYGILKTEMIYYPLGLILFTLFVLYIPIHANLIVGILISMVFLIHIPNYFEIKKRLSKVKS